MKTIKLNDLTLNQLNFAVAVCEGYITAQGDTLPAADLLLDVKGPEALAKTFRPSMDWEHGGPILNRIWIAVQPVDRGLKRIWLAADSAYRMEHFPHEGETALIAAMRAYVSMRLGDEIDIPDHMVETT